MNNFLWLVVSIIFFFLFYRFYKEAGNGLKYVIGTSYLVISIMSLEEFIFNILKIYGETRILLSTLPLIIVGLITLIYLWGKYGCYKEE